MMAMNNLIILITKTMVSQIVIRIATTNEKENDILFLTISILLQVVCIVGLT